MRKKERNKRYQDIFFCPECKRAIESIYGSSCSKCGATSLRRLIEPIDATLPEDLTQENIDGMWNERIEGAERRAYMAARLLIAERELARRRECEKVGINWKNR